MRPLRTKSEPKELLDTVSDSLAAMRGRAHRDTLVKAGLIAGGLAALTAGLPALQTDAHPPKFLSVKRDQRFVLYLPAQVFTFG